MNLKRNLLAVLLNIILATSIVQAGNPVYQFNFNGKPLSPAPIRWEDAIATYPESGITKFAATGVNANVLQTVVSGLGLTVTTDQKYVLIKAKTTSVDPNVGIAVRIGRYYNVWGDTCLRIIPFVTGGDWQIIRFNIDKVGFSLDKWYHLEFRTCQNFNYNWPAYGDFYFDELSVGGDILTGGTTVVPSLRETSTPASITTTTAVSGGNVTYDGGSVITERGICWGTSSGPTVSLSTKATDSGATGVFSVNLTGLSANTKYYVRSYATNSSGTCYGTQETFTTLPAAPSVTSASNISATGFTANWTAPTQGAAAFTYTLEYGTVSDLSSGTTQISAITSSNLSNAISSLVGNTTYYYRVKTVNATGSGTWSSIQSVTTSATVPNAPTNIVVIAGNAKVSVAFTAPANNGGSSILDYTVTATPGGLSATGAISPLVVTGLTNGTAYTFAVSARNSIGSSLAATSGSVTPDAIANNINVSTSTAIGSLTLTPVSDVVVSSNTLTINQSTAVNSITVAPGAKITVLGLNSITATNGIILQSDASGTATLLDNYSVPTISASVQQYVEAGRNWYISSPVSDAPYTSLDKGNSVVEFYEPTKTWVPVTSGNLVAGKGYIQVASAVQGTTGTVVFSNKLTNSGSVTVSLSRNGTTQAGFNLVGNPYPSYLRWTKVATANTNVLPTAWFRTKKTALAGGGYTFATVNVADTLNPIIVDNSANTTITKFIPPMQAYWVRLIENPATTDYTVTNAMRDHLDDAGNKFKAPAQKTSTQKLLRMQVSNGTNSDETVVYFNENASNTFDNYDSPKMSNNSASIPEIYTLAGKEQVVINGLNEVPYDKEFSLGFTTLTSGKFNLKASQFSNFAQGTQIILKDYSDINNPVTVDISDGNTYSFTSDITSNNTSRFTLIFKAPTVVSEINSNRNNDVWISTNANGQMFINGNSHGYTTIEVYNAVGQKLEAKSVTNSTTVLNEKYSSGIYILNLISNDGKVSIQKVVMK